MILQQLAQDADQIVGELPPPMYDCKPVRWVIDLDEAGTLLGITPLSGGGKKDRGKEMLVPFVKRTSGIRPILLADTPAYSLGLAPKDKNVVAKHQAYRDMVQGCVQETGNLAMKAVAQFLASWEPSRWPAGQELPGSSDLLTFRVAGQLPIEAREVRAFWAESCSAATDAKALPETECLVCGKKKSIADSLPVPIKRIPQGQTSGVAPVSANSNAFESYGLTRCKTCGVCAECGERFGKALNHLLAADDSHLTVGPLVYVFWTRESGNFSLTRLLNQPDPEAVRQMLSAYRDGVLRHLEADESAFYATALSASGGRAVIRDWLSTTLGDAKQHLARWFSLLRQVDPYGDEGQPLGVFRLAAGLYRDANKEMTAAVPRALVRAALHGSPLPTWLLAQAVNRCRAERAVTYPRAALIKAALQSQYPGKEETMSELESGEARPAYLCGRLLALLEEAQRLAIPGLNATLVDRFFGAASTAPASVFPRLLSGAQAHLAKLRKNSPGSGYALQERMEQVLLPLRDFPRILTLQEQALFSLGYYHQRAADRAAARARKNAAQNKEEASND